MTNIGVLSSTYFANRSVAELRCCSQHLKPIVSIPERVVTQREASFIPVRNGAFQNNNKSCLPITTSNRFKVLAEEEEEDHEKRLIGKSIV